MKRSDAEIRQLKEAIRSSRSIRQALIKLGLRPYGGNYAQLRKLADRYLIDISHFTGKGWNRGIMDLSQYRRIPLESILQRNSHYQSHKLRLRLIKEGYKKAQCEICAWAKARDDGSIPLELDHINGDRTDNRIENLRILCPNCHSLQPTHRGKNKVRPGDGIGIHT